MSEIENTQPARRFTFFGKAGNGEATREQVLGLDKIERYMGFFAAFIGIVTSLMVLPKFLSGKATTLVESVGAKAHNSCPTSYTYVAAVKACHRTVMQSHSYWTYLLFGTLIMSALLLLAVLRGSRPALIVTALIFGLAAGTAGLLFIALAAWLFIRAFRLQRYGDATFKGSNAIARQRGQVRTRREPRARRGAAPADPAKPAPAPSKRYTPKKKNAR